MHRFRAPALTLACLVAAAAAPAQRPDFSGHWTTDAPDAPSVASVGDASFRRGDMGSGWGSNITLTQTADSLVLSYEFFAAYDLQPPLRYAWALNGAESVNTIMIGHSPENERSRASWSGQTLVITTSYPAPPELGGNVRVEVRQTLTLASPTSLVLETTRAGVMGGPATTTRTVYTRR